MLCATVLRVILQVSVHSETSQVSHDYDELKLRSLCQAKNAGSLSTHLQSGRGIDFLQSQRICHRMLHSAAAMC